MARSVLRRLYYARRILIVAQEDPVPFISHSLGTDRAVPQRLCVGWRRTSLPCEAAEYHCCTFDLLFRGLITVRNYTQ